MLQASPLTDAEIARAAGVSRTNSMTWTEGKETTDE